MRKLMKDHVTLVLVAVGLVIAAIAAPALAGTVYSWTTDDGTSAFTDDPKRIPAKYKDKVERRQLGKLKNYKQYTESQVKHEATYEARVADRLEALRAPEPPAVSAGPPGQPAGVRYGLGIGATDNDQVSFPVDGDNGEPFVTTESRVKLKSSIATQDIAVTRQGDEVVSIRVSAPNQRGITDPVSPRILDDIE